MLYLIGLGLNKKSVSSEGKELIRDADKVYLEDYTVNFPYNTEDLDFGREIEKLGRGEVESNKLIKESKSKNIVLLVYGSPLIATTHSSLVLDCLENKIEYKIIHNASILDGITETGLQAYKFGKTASLPNWEEKGESKSFMAIIKNNQKIKAHTLILIDMNMELKQVLNQLNKAGVEGRIILCSQLGYKNEIYYENIENLEKLKVKKPFCIIVPGKLHFLEEEFLEKVSKI